MKKRSSTRGCGGWVKRTKMRVGSERKRRTEFQSEFQLLPVTPSDEVVKFAAAAASKSRFDKHLFSGPIIFFPFLFLTWVASLYFCVVPSNRDVSSERKGRKNEKNNKKNPLSSKRTKRNLQLLEESVGGRREKNVRLAQVAIFHVLVRRRRA